MSVPRSMRRKRKQDSSDVEEPVSRLNRLPDFDQASQGKPPNERAPSTAAQRRSLFVHSLPASATTESLTEFFSQSYPLKHATVVSNPVTRQSKGYGFVTFADPSDASAALQALDGTLFDGNQIKIEHADPRTRSSRPEHGGVASAGPSSTTTHTNTGATRHRQYSSNESPPQLIIRNLPWSISESEQLAMLFRSYGKVKRASVPQKRPGLSGGFGFVLLRGRKNAERALLELNGKIVDGRPLAIDWAVHKDVWESLHQNGGQSLDQEEDVPYKDMVSEVVNPTTEDSIRGDEAPEEKSNEDTVGLTGGNSDEFSMIEAPTKRGKEDDQPATLFVRNLPFNITDENLSQHFAIFGRLRYARVVMDLSTGRSRGTGFVCFAHTHNAVACLQGAPKAGSAFARTENTQNTSAALIKTSILEDVDDVSSSKYIMAGRILQLSRAVDRSEAARLAAVSSTFRDTRDKDKRRLYLLSEGTISSKTPLFQKLSSTEVALREQSTRQRQSLIKSNPALHLSLTRLSVRNIPRSINSKDLKALARQAVVGFALDVKAGLRQPLSKEELSRAGEAMRQAERARKAKGKGIVKQSKVMLEGQGGGKVTESSGAGRSKGYGFIEYTSHRWALMGLRWLNGHSVSAKSDESSISISGFERSKRLIVEFAIENAQVVGRRQERESRSQGRKGPTQADALGQLGADTNLQKKRKRDVRSGSSNYTTDKPTRPSEAISGSHQVNMQEHLVGDTGATERSAKKRRIIGRKRLTRKDRKLN